MCDVELPTEDYLLANPGWVGLDITGNVAFSSTTLAALIETGNKQQVEMLLERAKQS